MMSILLEQYYRDWKLKANNEVSKNIVGPCILRLIKYNKNRQSSDLFFFKWLPLNLLEIFLIIQKYGFDCKENVIELVSFTFVSIHTFAGSKLHHSVKIS